jgi:hypothetical protein
MTFRFLVFVLILAVCGQKAAVAELNEPQFRKPVNCANLSDGIYVWGCSRFYSVCSNGKELAMNCFAGLKLNPDNNQCDEPKSIHICNSQSSAAAAQLFRSKEPFTCEGKPDATFEAGPCSANYIQCTHGKRFDQTCPNGLLYNAKSGVCDFASKCRKSPGGGTRRMIGYGRTYYGSNLYGPPNPPAQNFAPAPRPQPVPVAPKAPSPPAGFSCAGKEDGLYLEQPGQCAKAFFKCAHGQSFNYTCPAGLFYNADNGQCDYQAHVVACGGRAPSEQVTPPPPPPLPKFDCTGKMDGYYAADQCAAQYFFSCLGGHSTTIACYHGLVFDEIIGACDFPEQCGKSTPPPPVEEEEPEEQQTIEQPQNEYYYPQGTPYYTPYEQPQLEVAPNTQYFVPSQTEPVELAPVDFHVPVDEEESPEQPSFSCSGKPNGFYFTKSCVPSYINCNHGNAHPITCPEDLVFDPKFGQCEFKEICEQYNNEQ